MAVNIKKTDHLFVPFNQFGLPLSDRNSSVRIYKNLKTLQRYNQYKPTEMPWEVSAHSYVEVIEYAPLRRAKWLPARDIGDCCYRCSACGKVIDHYLDEDDNYCAKCGAKMDKEREA